MFLALAFAMPFMGIVGDFVMARREVVVWIRWFASGAHWLPRALCDRRLASGVG